MATLQALDIYPVKSCRGIAREAAQVTTAGFVNDREWMIVRSDGRFVTQRELPRLALVQTALTNDALILSAAGFGELRVELAASGEGKEVVCWRDRCAALDAGTEAAAWISDFLGASYRLVRFDPRHERECDPQWTQELRGLSRFADAFPWLVISQASLDDLNARLPEALPMNRFRPNIVIAGVEPYAEDRIHEIDVGGVTLRLVKPCTRCAIPTTDQNTGERASDEPLRTLKKYRSSRNPMGVLFGQNAVLVQGAGKTLNVGASLTVRWKSEEKETPLPA